MLASMDRSFTSMASRAATMGFLASLGLAGMYAGCGGTDATTQSTGSAGPGGASTAASTSGAGGSGGTATSTASSTASASTSAATTAGAGGGSSSASSSAAGTGGGGFVWPTCDAPEPGAVQKTLHQVWQDNPAAPTEVWSPGLFVTGVSKGGCQSGVACQIFVQQAENLIDLAGATQQSLKMFISANTAFHFLGIKVGDKVDVDAHAWRYNVGGENELLLQVSLALPGCAKVVGAGNPLPVPALLSDLSVSAYEDTLGPVLVKVSSVSGTPQMPAQTFGLYNTKPPFDDAGVASVTSLSPYFMSSGVFTGYVAMNTGAKHDFASVTGVFGIFIPTGSMTKYEEIYPRSEADYPQGP
jgi:hypothetical protein